MRSISFLREGQIIRYRNEDCIVLDSSGSSLYLKCTYTGLKYLLKKSDLETIEINEDEPITIKRKDK